MRRCWILEMKTFLKIALLCLVLFANSTLAQEARKIDEFYPIDCEDYLGRMDNFYFELQENPTAKGYFLIYEGKFRKYSDTANKFHYVSPHFGEGKSYIKSIKRRLMFRRYSVEKMSFVEAGFREEFTIEFWLVPEGAKPPKPTPTLEKTKYRKGKPAGFCYGPV